MPKIYFRHFITEFVYPTPTAAATVAMIGGGATEEKPKTAHGRSTLIRTTCTMSSNHEKVFESLQKREDLFRSNHAEFAQCDGHQIVSFRKDTTRVGAVTPLPRGPVLWVVVRTHQMFLSRR